MPLDLEAKPVTIFNAPVGTAAAALIATTTAYVAKSGIDVKALAANTAPVYIGTSTAVTTSTGWELSPGESKRFLSTNPATLCGISSSASQALATYSLEAAA